MLLIGSVFAALLIGYALGCRAGRIEGYVAGIATELVAEGVVGEEAYVEHGCTADEHLCAQHAAQHAAAPWN